MIYTTVKFFGLVSEPKFAPYICQLNLYWFYRYHRRCSDPVAFIKSVIIIKLNKWNVPIDKFQNQWVTWVTIYWWFVHKTFFEFYFNTCRLPNQPHILSQVYKKGFEKLRLNGRVVNVEDFRVYDLCVKMKKKVWYISLEIIRIAHKKWTTKEQHSLAWYWWQYF